MMIMKMSASRQLSLASLFVASVCLFGALAGAQSSESAAEKQRDSGSESIANANVQLSPTDMATAAGHHYGGSHGKYYMYAESPKKGAYKMGFKRGNGKHMIERKESVHKSHVESYFKWQDKKGKGSHKFEYLHSDHKGKHHY